MGAGPRIHEFLRELREKGLGEEYVQSCQFFLASFLLTKLIQRRSSAVAIGELGNYPSLEQVLTYVGTKRKELDMV